MWQLFENGERLCDSMDLVKVANLESMVLVSQTVQPYLGILSFFDTDLFSQIKLTKLPLIHCFKPFIRKKL